MTSPYDSDLDKNPANYQPLTPLPSWSARRRVPDRIAIVHGNHASPTPILCALRAGWRRRSSARHRPGDTVSVVLANTPPMLEAHYGVPMIGAVLHTINTRLDAAVVAFMLDHAEPRS